MAQRRFPGESAAYREARDRLLEQEIELRRATEAVAAARRELPPGGPVPEDYVFDGADGKVRMSELFEPGQDSLVIYSFMFPRDPDDDTPGPETGKVAELPLHERPCPSCTALLDQLEPALYHAGEHLNFAAVAKARIEYVADFGRTRGWRSIRLLSSSGNSYNRAYHGETESGTQIPTLNVFARDGEEIRHFWGSELFFAPADGDQDPRHLGTIEPLWNLLDLTREGRPAGWYEQFDY